MTKYGAMKKVYVAMSGGVDSSVAAALLKKKGFEVVGVFFKPWAPFATPFAKDSKVKKDLEGHGNSIYFCDWEKDRRDAMAVAEVLGIPFKTWDFSVEYKNKVGDYMIESYRQGITPNPDVMCNKEIKFGLFLKKSLKEGADFIATGHYIRLKPQFSIFNFQFSQKKVIHYKLLKAKDKNKDQSYFLWTLVQEQLRHCLFPIGDYAKPEVRKLAKKFGLPTFDKKDSQGVCFIGQLDMKEFLKKYIPAKPGSIIWREDLTARNPVSRSRNRVSLKTIGVHEGAAYYTIGQRHGLNISSGGGPYYVSGKDLKKNLVFVTKNEKKLEEKEIIVGDINWINPIIHSPSLFLRKLKIRARYRTPTVSAKFIRMPGLSLQRLKIKTAEPIRAIAPGQSVVFYRGQEMLGGGIIT